MPGKLDTHESTQAGAPAGRVRSTDAQESDDPSPIMGRRIDRKVEEDDVPSPIMGYRSKEKPANAPQVEKPRKSTDSEGRGRSTINPANAPQVEQIRKSKDSEGPSPIMGRRRSKANPVEKDEIARESSVESQPSPILGSKGDGERLSSALSQAGSTYAGSSPTGMTASAAGRMGGASSGSGQMVSRGSSTGRTVSHETKTSSAASGSSEMLPRRESATREIQQLNSILAGVPSGNLSAPIRRPSAIGHWTTNSASPTGIRLHQLMRPNPQHQHKTTPSLPKTKRASSWIVS